jgi:hypothetical protein
MTELEQENEDLRERVAELEGAVDPNPTGKEYDDMNRGERVFRVRVAVARRAADSNGKGSYVYKDVSTLFNEQPSSGYCFKLLREAAEADGFDFDESTRPKRLTVNLDGVNSDAIVHAVKNNNWTEGGE